MFSCILLKDCVIGIIENKTQIEVLGKRAYEYAVSFHSSEKNMEHLISLF